jgi:hypothetical protein
MTRKKRKPMTAEQRAAAVERLAKARAAKKPAQYKNIDPSVLAIDADNEFSMVNVKKYIKNQTVLAAAYRKAAARKEKGAVAKLSSTLAYKRMCESYLRNGVWISDFIGMEEEKKVSWQCVAMAYDKNGVAKRTHGVYYDDIKEVYK